MRIYEKPVRLLMREMVQSPEIKGGEIFDREQVVDWFASHYPLIKRGTVAAHLVLLSTNDPGRLHHTPKANGDDDLFFRSSPGRYRLYDRRTDPIPISSQEAIKEDDQADKTVSFANMTNSDDSEFAYEHDLRDYLARNLHLIEPDLKLYQDEGISGVEFPVGGRFIDILAMDKFGGYVVIELKVSKGYDRVIGQLLRYMGWIKKNHADPGQVVRGVIVAKTISEDILLACSELKDVVLFEYSLSVTLRPVSPSSDRG